MSDKLAIKNINKAIKRLPDAKTYSPEKITVAVDKHKYNFEKVKNEWHYIT